MDLKPYQSYFHDGYVNALESKNNTIKIWMTSAVLVPEFDVTGIQFDAENAISGCLIAYNVSELLINGITTNTLKMNFDDGEIEELELFGNSIYLNASWQDYLMKTSTCEEIHISAEKIDWINGDYPNTKYDIRK